MTFVDSLNTIRDTLQNVLGGPTGELANAGLGDFDRYLNKSDLQSDDKELCVYIDNGSDTTDQKTVGFIIKAQLYRVTDDVEVTSYNDVIFKAIRDNITPTLLEYQERDSINFEQFPFDIGSSSAFIFYQIQFKDSLDDCQEA